MTLLKKTLHKLNQVIIASIIVGILYTAIVLISKYAINWNSYEKQITEQLEKSFGKGSISISHLDGSLLMPKINAYNAYLNSDNNNTSQDILVIPKIEMSISILSMLFLKPQINTLNIKSIDLKPTHIKNLSKLIMDSKQTIYNVNIDHGKLKSNSNLFKDIEFKDLTLKLNKGTLLITSNILVGEYTYKLALDFNDKKQHFSLDSTLLRIKFNGENSQGTLNVSGNNFANNIGMFIKPISLNNDPWSEFTINATLSWSTNNLKISTFKLLDKNIKLDLDFEHIYSTNHTDISVLIDELNLDSLLRHQDHNNFSLLDLKQYLEGDKNINSSGKIFIQARDIVYNNNVVDSVIFNSVTNGKTLKINQFTFYMPGETNGEIKGNISNNDIISRFEGDISLNSTNAQKFLEWAFFIKKKVANGVLNFNSEISITPKAFSLNNTKLTVDELNLESSLFIRNNKRGTRIKSQLKLENLDLNQYEFNELIKGKTLYSIIHEVDFDLNAYNIISDNNVVDKFSLKLLSDTGKILLKKIRFDSQNLQAEGNITLVNEGIDTSIQADITANYINTKIFTKLHILDIYYDPDRPIVTWSSKPISWLGLQDLRGNITGKIKKLDTKYFSLNNVDINLDLGDTVLSVNKFNAEVNEDGKVDITANIGMESESSTLLSFALNNIDLSQITQNMFNINTITQGKISCVGGIKSKGSNVNELINNLDGKMEIASRNIEVTDFDIDELLTKLPEIKSNSELATLTKVLIYSNKTKFQYLDGLVNINHGNTASTLKFKTGRSSGILSSHLSLKNFETNSIMRFFFVKNNQQAKVLSIDMNISGPIWLPKLSFDNKQIYDMIIESRVS